MSLIKQISFTNFHETNHGLFNTFVLVLILFLSTTDSVSALPQDPTVQSGDINIQQPTSTQLNVIQGSDKAIIDWRAFSIDTQEHVDFQLQSSSGLTLNRVTGNDPSSIFGKLTSNGQLFLINPNGILFGATSRIDVNGLIATTTDIRNEDFLSGNYNFNIPSTNSSRYVINRGDITVAQGGLIALVAPGVSNSGIINARLGKVSLASGNTFTLDLYGDQLVNFGIDSEITESVTGVDGETLDALVSNRGKIFADGGIVTLQVKAAQGVVSQVINMEGVIEAKTFEDKEGTILLEGGNNGIVNVSGRLTASGNDSEERGGTVHILGNKVGLFSTAYVDVSGHSGGGTALIGGDYQGNGKVQNAYRTFLSAESTINADAVENGNGGKVITWADDTTRAFGTITAKGGNTIGDGGFIEVSGKKNLDFQANVDLSADKGKLGTLLLDPTNIEVIQLSENSTTTADQVDEFSDPSGNFKIDPDKLFKTSGNIILQADNDITVSDNLGVFNTRYTSTLTMNAGNSIIVKGNISFMGDITLTAANGITVDNAEVRTNKGNLTIDGDSDNSFDGKDYIQVINNKPLFGTTGNNQLFAGGKLILNAKTGGIITSGSNPNLFVSGTEILLNDNLTTEGLFIKLTGNGTTSSRVPGTGNFALASGKNINVISGEFKTASSLSILSIEAYDFDIQGNISNPSGVVRLTSLEKSFGLGDGTGTAQINGTEISHITAKLLAFEQNTDSGNINLSNITTENLTNVEAVSIQALSRNTTSISFSGLASTLPSLDLLAGSLVVNAPITTTKGSLKLKAQGDISFNGTGDLVSAGNIEVINGGGRVFLDENFLNGPLGSTFIRNPSIGKIVMDEGTEFDAGTGTIKLTADNNITLGLLKTTNSSTSAITLTSINGGVRDADTNGALDIITPRGESNLNLKLADGFGTPSNNIEIRGTETPSPAEVSQIINRVARTNQITPNSLSSPLTGRTPFQNIGPFGNNIFEGPNKLTTFNTGNTGIGGVRLDPDSIFTPRGNSTGIGGVAFESPSIGIGGVSLGNSSSPNTPSVGIGGVSNNSDSNTSSPSANISGSKTTNTSGASRPSANISGASTPAF